MPLKSGKSKAVIQANIAMLIREGRKPDQAAAIAYEHAGIARKKGKTRKTK